MPSPWNRGSSVRHRVPPPPAAPATQPRDGASLPRPPQPPAVRSEKQHFHYAASPCSLILFRPHCSGCPFPSPHLKALGSATQGQARDRDSRAALDNPQDRRHVRQTYSGRSARVATRPESQAAPPHIFNFPRRLSPEYFEVEREGLNLRKLEQLIESSLMIVSKCRVLKVFVTCREAARLGLLS